MRREQAQPQGLGIAVDRDAEIPIGVQLAWALRARIRDGELEPGQRLPGLREAAQQTGVNVNTVRAVYQRLEREGLIASHQGSGTFVAERPRRRSTVASIAADAAREARETGVDPREVAAALYVVPGASRPSATAAVARRRALREQIAALERTLGEMEAKHPGLAPPGADPRQPGANAGPALLDAAELEQVRTALVRRLAAIQAAVDRLGEGEQADAEAPARKPRAERARDDARADKRAGKARARARTAPAGA